MPDLDFTGERMVPGKVEPQLEFEHLSRYRFVAPHVVGKSVVDLGCGAGYGAALLKAVGARTVVGLDIASRCHSVRPGLLRRGRALLRERGLWRRSVFARALPTSSRPSRSSSTSPSTAGFWLWRGALLDGRGLFFVSTPNKRVYRDESHAPPNPFHVKEFYYEEFRDLLGEFFPRVLMVGQSTTEGMLFSPLETSAELTASLPEETRDRKLSETTDFLVAICGFDEAVERAGSRSSFMASSGNELRRRSRMIDALQSELEDRTRWAKSLDATVDARTVELAQRKNELAARDAEVARQSRELVEKDAEVAKKTGRLSDLERELEERQRQAAEIEEVAERSRREVAELRRKLEERLRIARKLKREVAERDRQFLERLRDLERLEARTRQLEEVRDRSEQLQALLGARLEVAGELIGELEDEQTRQDALLGWNRESVVEQARRLQATEVAGVRLDSRTRGLEASVVPASARAGPSLARARPARRAAGIPGGGAAAPIGGARSGAGRGP